MSGVRDRSHALACLLLMSMVLLSARLKAENQPKQELMVAAAASLKDVLEEIGPAFEQDHPGFHVTFHFASSGALQQQIEQGAPVDVFISAAPQQLEALRQKNFLLPDSVQNLCGNELVLIVPRTQVAPQSPRDLLKSPYKKIALGEARTVPAGQYAEAWLKNLGLHARLKPRLVPAANVRQVLTFVASGNVSAGFVYASDARTSSQVKVALRAAPSQHPPITYPLAIIKKSKRPAAARTFAQFLQGEKARGLLLKHGFLVPTGKAS